MAVYTTLTTQDFQHILTHYDCGSYVAHEGITGGIENTNYFVTTQTSQGLQEWVLTIFERLNSQQLPYYLELTAFLASQGLRVSAPTRLKNDALMFEIQHKSAALAQRLPGVEVKQVTPKHCAQVGQLLAQMHVASPGFSLRQDNMRGLAWWRSTIPSLFAYVPPAIAALLADELAEQLAFSQTPLYAALGRGAVHADLFCDNVLFAPDGTAGAIDFYFAGDDTFLFDLCVTVNDWCVDRDASGYSTGVLNTDKLQAFMQAYLSLRALTEAERQAMPLMARAAALRFWVSRLDDWYKPRSASQLVAKDPTHFERVLHERRRLSLTPKLWEHI